MKNIRIRTIIYSLIVLAILASGYLAYVNRIGADEGICIVGNDGENGCADVQDSKYGSLLGIKVCHLGLFAFGLLFLVYMGASMVNKYRRNFYRLFLGISFIGALLAVYFLFVQFFILKTICSTCIIIDLAAIFIFILGCVEYNGIWRR